MGATFHSVAATLLTGLLSLSTGSTSSAQASSIALPQVADKIVFIAQPSAALEDASGFLNATSRHSALLSPTTIQGLFASALPPEARLLDLASLKASGIDVSRPISLYKIGGHWLGCYKMTSGFFSEGNVLSSSEKERGFQTTSIAEKGLILWKVTDSFNVVQRVAISQKNKACITGGGVGNQQAIDSAKWILNDSSKTREKSPLKEALISVSKDSTVHHVVFAAKRSNGKVIAATIKPSGKTPALEVDGVISDAGDFFASQASMKPFDIAPPADSPPALIDLTLAPAVAEHFDSKLQQVLRRGVPSLSERERDAFSHKILKSLQGRMVLAISGVNPNHSAGSIHQIRQAVFARVTAPQELAPLLEQVARRAPRATSKPLTESGHVASFEGTPIWFGLKGNTLYFANDNVLASQMLVYGDGRISSPTNEAIAVAIDGPALAQALSRISMFHLAQGKLFQQLFALKMDISGILKKSGLILVTASPKGHWLSFHGDLDLSGKCAPCELSKRAAERQKKRQRSK